VKITTKQLVEILGVSAVAGSLLFVGMQLNLDRKVANAEQYANRAESIKADIRARLESDASMSAALLRWEAGERYDWWPDNFEAEIIELGFSGKEVEAEILQARLNLYQYDNLYFQYQQGLLDEQFWQRARTRLKIGMRNENSYARYVYPATSVLLPISAVLDELLAEIEDESKN